MEDRFPGLWQTWFLEQTAAIGWPPNKYSIDARKKENDWRLASQIARRVQVGDKIIVQLSNHHVGRIGTVIAAHIEDDEWKETVPETKYLRQGEMGRRFDVRWDLTVGQIPISPSAIAKLPESARFTGPTLRRTIFEVHPKLARSIEKALKDIKVWTTLQHRFASERSISEYIAAYPHRLEDGMVVYPNKKVREYVFQDRKRIDVLLLDKAERLVVVECKQGVPTKNDINQLCGYMSRAKNEISSSSIIRGILVHGGALKLSEEIRKYANKRPHVELVRFSVSVDFMSSR
jgi:hypothetical protein